jgi:hypothetical protein
MRQMISSSSESTDAEGLYTRGRRKKLMKLFEKRAPRYNRPTRGKVQAKAERILSKPVSASTVRRVLRALTGDDGYALIGGHAVTIHGHPRTTEDIDILVRPEDVGRIVAALGGTGPQPLAIGGVSLKVKSVTVDVVAPSGRWVGPAIDAAETTPHGRVISKPFLVLSKLWAMRGEQDDTDVLYVLKKMSPRERKATRALVSRYLPADADDLDSMLALARPGG